MGGEEWRRKRKDEERRKEIKVEEERGKEKKRREEYCMTNALHRLMYPFESGFLTSCLELNTM